MKKRVDVFFSGTVQGVGFRYTVEKMARRYEVTGFVRNLPDGRVEVVAEGEEDEVREFLRSIEDSSLGSYVRDKQVSWQDFKNQYRVFEITFG